MPEQYIEQDFIVSVIKQLASNKDAVKVVRSVDEMGVLYTVTVAKEDTSKIIGRNGNTANAIRTLLRVIASENRVRATMKIDAPYVQKAETRKEV